MAPKKRVFRRIKLSLYAIIRLDVEEVNKLLLPREVEVRTRLIARKLVRRGASNTAVRYFIYHCVFRQLDILLSSPNPKQAAMEQLYGVAVRLGKRTTFHVRERIATYGMRIRKMSTAGKETRGARRSK